jgi:lysophospholipase L1-like esterase
MMALRYVHVGNSTDDATLGPEFGWTPATVGARLTEATGEPVETTLIFAFPTPGLGRFLSRRLDAIQPDVVILHLTGFALGAHTLYPWLSFLNRQRTVHQASGHALALVTRLLGCSPLYPPYDRRGLRQRLYGAAYDAAIRRGLGRPQVALDQYLEAYEGAIRMLAAREDTLTIVRGPIRSDFNIHAPAALARANADIQTAEVRAATLCTERRVPYVSMFEVEARHGGTEPWFMDDGMHASAHAQRLTADAELALLLPLLDAGYVSKVRGPTSKV